MPDGKPTIAPLIIFGSMLVMSIVSVSIVFITHSKRTEPYLDTKIRRVKTKQRPATKPVVKPVVKPAVVDTPAIDAGALQPTTP